MNQLSDFGKDKVREQILSLPLETLVCTGHDSSTTGADEREHKPFFNPMTFL
jgi:hypothetical protein